MKTRSKLGHALAVGLLLAIGAAFGQAPSKPAFEVATVKPAAPVDMAKVNAEARAGKMPKFVNIDGAQASYSYIPLKALIAIAYRVNVYQIAGPAWLDKERFDIVAKIPDGASKSDVPKMLQTLLEERFKLAVHWGTEERPALALIVGKDGPKLTESAATPVPFDENAPLKAYQVKADTPEGPVLTTMNPDGSMITNMGRRGTITQRSDPRAQTLILDCSGVTMAVFADRLTRIFLSRGEGRQVVDMTGLKGQYEFSVMVDTPSLVPAEGAGANASPAIAASEPSGGSSLFSSVKKLGLVLEPRRAPVQQLVIDHVEKTPTEN